MQACLGGNHMDLRRKRDTTAIASVVVAVCILIVLIVGIFIAVRGGKSGTDQPVTVNTTVKDGPIAGFDARQDKNPDNILSYRINSAPYFPTSTEAGDVYIENPAENNYGILVDYELPNEDIIYTSKLISPNRHLQTDYLSDSLSEGIYDVVARIYAVDLTSNEIVGYVEQNIKLHIGVKK